MLSRNLCLRLNAIFLYIKDDSPRQLRVEQVIIGRQGEIIVREVINGEYIPDKRQQFSGKGFTLRFRHVIGKLVLLKPFSGSGSTARLSDLLATYGAERYIGRCACVAYGSSETVFYISAVYFAGSKKNLAKPVVIALLANFVSLIFGCLFCRIL